MLSSYFRHEQIHNCHIYDFGQTLLCYNLNVQQDPLWCLFFNKSSCLAVALGATKFTAIMEMELFEGLDFISSW